MQTITKDTINNVSEISEYKQKRNLKNTNNYYDYYVSKHGSTIIYYKTVNNSSTYEDRINNSIIQDIPILIEEID
jgi:hypothetical protein